MWEHHHYTLYVIPYTYTYKRKKILGNVYFSTSQQITTNVVFNLEIKTKLYT